MNLAQRGMRPRRPLRKPSPPAPAATGLAATSLTIGQVRFPHGSRVPDEIVSTIEPGRLAVLMSNRLLMHRLGPPPTNAPAPVPLPPPVDPAVALAEQWAAVERDGYAEWGITAGVPTPAGPFASVMHPSTMTKASRWPVSQSGGVIDDKGS